MRGDEEREHMRVAAALAKSPLLWHHTPNGGKRDATTAHRLKLMGVQAGVPDILIYDDPPTAIEMKRSDGKGRVSNAQKKWKEELEKRGWGWYVCNGAEEAFDVIKRRYGWERPKRTKLRVKAKS